MTWLSDSTQQLAGAWRSSAYAGHGIRGDAVPQTGAHGASILWGTGSNITLPAEAADEFRALILTRPAGLPGLVIGEDSAVEVPEDSPAGTHIGTWRGYKNGVAFGPDPSTYSIVIGGGVLSGGATLDDVAAGGTIGGGTASQLGGTAVLDDVTAAGFIGAALAWEMALNMYTLLAPVDQIDNLGGFAIKDPDDTVTLGFEFKRYTTAPQAATVSISRKRGAADPTPSAVLLDAPGIMGSKVFQRVQGGVAYCDYTVTVEATALDGSVYTMSGVLPVRPK